MARYFTIIVGNNGSYLTLNNGNTIVHSVFIESLNNEATRADISKLFKKYSRTSIYIILDNVGQNYNKKKFQNVGFFDVRKIAERKFNYEIPKGDLKEKRFLGKNKQTGDWEYMFISSPIDDFLQDWLNIIEVNTNILQGIYMLPLETENVLKKLQKTLFAKGKETKWNIVLFENKVSGFREITFFDKLLLFTRILSFEIGPTTFLQNFQNNVSRTIEYLKRFSRDFKLDDLTIFIITNADRKKEFANINEKNIKVYTTKEFATLFKVSLPEKFLTNYSDILLQSIIMRSKKIISFSNKEMKSMKLLSTLLTYINIFKNVGLAVVSFIFVIIFSYFIKNKAALKIAERNYRNKQQEFEQKKKVEFGDGLTNLDNIIDISAFYSDIKSTNVNMFVFLKSFSAVSSGIFLVNSTGWNINNFTKNKFTPNIQSKSSFSIDGVLINKTGKIDDLFKIYEEYEKKLKTTFPNYSIVLPSLPKNINFNTSYFSFPLKIDFVEK